MPSSPCWTDPCGIEYLQGAKTQELALQWAIQIYSVFMHVGQGMGAACEEMTTHAVYPPQLGQGNKHAPPLQFAG